MPRSTAHARGGDRAAARSLAQAPREALDRDEALIRDAVLRMGTLVEAAIREASRALTAHDAALALEVISGDAIINEAQRARLAADPGHDRDPAAGRPRPALPPRRSTTSRTSSSGWATTLPRSRRRSSSSRRSRRSSTTSTCPRWPSSRPSSSTASSARSSNRMRSRHARSRSEDDEIDRLYHATFDAVVELMREDPAQRRARHSDHHRVALPRADRRPGDEHRRGRRLPRHRRRRGPQSVTPESPIRVLFVCTGNSARSIMAEALLRQQGGAAFEVYSAGTEPRGINPLTIRTLEAAGIDASWARSKSVTEYLGQRVRLRHHRVRPGAPELPGLPRRPRIAPLGLRGPGRSRRDRGGAARGLPTGLHRAGPADRDVHPARARAGVPLSRS